jgi:diguanylate cyclase (GGDEF)-like protein
MGVARLPTSPAAWWRYLLLLAVPVGLLTLVLTSEWDHAALDVAVGYPSAAFCVWRWRGRPTSSSAWLWIGAGLFLNATGSIVEAALKVTALPSVADVFYLALYPGSSLGLLILVRSRYPGLGVAKLIDAGALTVGLGLLCWVFLIRPTADNATGSILARAVAIAYPVGDLMLLAILARVMTADGWRTPAVRLLCGALLGFLIGDSAWALVNNNNWNVSDFASSVLSEPFVFAYALLGAAALHGSAGELAAPAPESDERMSRVLLGALTLASLVAPSLLAAEALSGKVIDGVAIAVCSAQLSLLIVWRAAYLVRHVERQSQRLRDLALEDPLTGLPNRRALQSYLAGALQRARREGRPICLALLDLDRFKQFNDEYGHTAGDHLLKSSAASWARQVRGTDMLARVGGEEFVLVLPDADAAQADAVIEKLRGATPLGQMFSAGLCEWDSEVLAEELIELADAAMYRAKRAGGNRTARAVVAPQSY